MFGHARLATAALLGFALGAQAFQLQGRIANRSGKPIAGATVALSPLGLSDTTDSEGRYAIAGPSGIARQSRLSREITLRDGLLEVPLSEAAPVNVEVFDTRSTKLVSDEVALAPAGVHRWKLAGTVSGARLVVIRVAVGEQTFAFRHAQIEGRAVGAERLVLARAAAAGDSLAVSAKGYLPRKVAVPALDATLDVVLDTATTGTNPAGGSAGCGKAPALASGSRTIQVGSDNRGYMLRIPPGYDNKRPYPLVFAFHWNGGTMGDVDGGGSSGYTWSYYGLREKADKSTDKKMIFVAPQGIGNGWANSGGRDLRLVDDLVKVLKNDLCVDTTRVFSMGFSYGGGMTYAISCARAGVFRGAAVYAGAQLSGCEDGTRPIAYIGLHGLRDGTCTIAGGRGLRDRFVKNNGCTPQNPPEPSNGSLKHTCTTYQGCKEGYPVRWCAFDGAGHSPAPVDGSTNDSGGGDKTWTKDEVWTFFTQL